VLEFAMEVISQKRQANEIANGMRPELFYGFIREVSCRYVTKKQLLVFLKNFKCYTLI
jgi:hypothetical protein